MPCVERGSELCYISVQTDLYMRGLVTSAVEQADRRKLALMLGSAGRIKELDLWASEEVIRAFNAPTRGRTRQLSLHGSSRQR